MATATEHSSTPHSPKLRRESRHLSSPWSRVVRGEPEVAIATPSSPSQPPPIAAAVAIAPPEPSDLSPPKAAAALDEQPAGDPADVAVLLSASDGAGQGGGAGDAAAASGGKKPAWTRPSNGAIEAGSVMGAASWPALSEATRASSRSSSSDSVKGLSDGSTSAPPAHVIISSPPKQIAKSTSFSSSTNHGSPTRQKSMKRSGSTSSGSTITDSSGGALANGGPVPPSLVPSSADVPEDALDKPVISQPSSSRNTSNWDHGSRGGGGSPQSHVGSEQHRNYGGNRRGNNSGGGGSPHYSNFGNRRGPERGGYDWNNRSFGGGRDLQVQQQQQQQPRAMARPFLRPLPPVSAPFMGPPPPGHPFASPLGYYDISSPIFYVPSHPSPESHGGMSFAGTPAMFYAAPDSQLRATLAKQIDYYFSPENLCKDTYLRQNMDEEGWVSISLIANFNRVRNLTNNIQFILDTVRTSTVVEVQGDKVRRRIDWMNWPPIVPASNPPHSSAIPSYETLAAHMRNVTLEEGTTSLNSTTAATGTVVVVSGSSMNSQSQMTISNRSGSKQSIALASADQRVPTRSLGRSDTF